MAIGGVLRARFTALNRTGTGLLHIAYSFLIVMVSFRSPDRSGSSKRASGYEAVLEGIKSEEEEPEIPVCMKIRTLQECTSEACNTVPEGYIIAETMATRASQPHDEHVANNSPRGEM